MNRRDLLPQLKRLARIISEERRAAKALAIDEMLELTEKKEALLKRISPLADSAGHLSEEEKKAADEVYTENLKNAYFFWSALKWVRQSVNFIGEQVSTESYEQSGARKRAGYSGALFSGKV